MKLQKLATRKREKTYQTQAYLKIHISTIHEGRKVFVCNICDSTFSQSQSLKSHKTRQHDKKFFDNNLVPLKQKIYKCDI